MTLRQEVDCMFVKNFINKCRIFDQMKSVTNLLYQAKEWIRTYCLQDFHELQILHHISVICRYRIIVIPLYHGLQDLTHVCVVYKDSWITRLLYWLLSIQVHKLLQDLHHVGCLQRMENKTYLMLLLAIRDTDDSLLQS